MTPEPVIVTKRISASVAMLLESQHQPTAVRARLGYRADRPFEMAATFYTPDDESPTTWVFARDLLLDGRNGFTGQGDIQIWPLPLAGHTRVFLSLTSNDGDCLLSVDGLAVDSWCEAMEALVPRGTEIHHFDIDAQLARFLG